MNSKIFLAAALTMLGGAIYATPALSQEADPLAVEALSEEAATVAALAEEQALTENQGEIEPDTGLVNGVFGLVIEGEVPEDYSFYAEANIGNGGEVICTTDDRMVGLGYPECQGGGAVNEVPFVAPEGQEIEYRLLGSQGAGLSQTVVSAGTVAAAEGLRIEAAYAFNGTRLEDHTQDPIREPDFNPDVDGGQYSGVSGVTAEAEEAVAEEAVADEAVIPAEEAAQEIEPGSVADVATGGTGLLPETGGLALVPALGAALLAAALLLKRLIP